MYLVVCNDVHLSDRSPRWRTETYTEDILEKLGEIVDICNELNADLFCTGDVFHYPQPAKTSHWLVSRAMQVVGRLDHTMFIVPGNHDLPGGRMDGLVRTPLESLSKLPNVDILNGYVKYNGLNILGIPWQYDMTDVDFKNRINEVRPDIIFTHAAISPRMDMPYETIYAPNVAGVAPVICYGHMHTKEEPYVMAGTTFVNPGAVSRGSLSEDDLQREPCVAVVEFIRTGAVTTITEISYRKLLKAKPISEVFRLETAQARKETDASILDFVEKLEHQSIKHITLEDLLAMIKEKSDDPQVVQEATDILQSL